MHTLEWMRSVAVHAAVQVELAVHVHLQVHVNSCVITGVYHLALWL